MSNRTPIRVTDTTPPADLSPDVAEVWRKLAPLVDQGTAVVLPHHLTFAYRALCERVALNRRFRVRITDAIPWFKPFGITARQVARVF